MVQLMSAPVDKLIGQRIQVKRRELGYSAEKLAEYVGISQQQLSRYERGTNKINVAHLVNIASFLNTPISWFFQDCSLDSTQSEADQHWIALSEEQKQAFVAFLNLIQNKTS